MLAKLILSLFFLPMTMTGLYIDARSFFVNPGIDTTAEAYVVRDINSGSFVMEKNADRSFPIASLTKLMTALVFLDQGVDMEKIITLLPEDDRIGGKLYIDQGEEVSVRDLFYSMLVGSANNASVALVRSTGLSIEEFVNKMNKKAQEFGMTKTRFSDPTGLDVRNSSSARDVSVLVQEALKYPEIRQALQTKIYKFQTRNTHNDHTIRNTNLLLESFLAVDQYQILGGKTGYLDEVGYCLGLGVKKDNQELIVVVLGADSSNARFSETKALIYWVFSNIYNRP